ncbi:SOS response-associated peptidase [Actinokineospora sp. NPDC004072]
MCGRYAATKDPAALAAEFDAIDAIGADAPRADYNVAPTKTIVTVVQRHPRDADGNVDETTTERTLRLMKWGLVPSWAKDASGAGRMINTRSESAAEKPSFKRSLARHRCIIPADGWYEWKRDGKVKQPFYTTPKDGSSLAMAGIWSTWHDKNDPDAPVLITCSVLTTDSVGPLTEIHHRMPLLLSRDEWNPWLDPDRTDVGEFLRPVSEDVVAALELRPISDAVNSVRNNGPDLLNRVDPAVDLDLFST